MHLCTKEQGGVWVEVMGVLGSVKSREGCGGVQLTGEWRLLQDPTLSPPALQLCR